MIKTNLFVKSTGSKSAGAFFAGLDISMINLPMIILSILLFYSDGVLKSFYLEPQKTTINSEIESLREERRGYQEELKKKDEYKNKIESIKVREKEFLEKIRVFKEIISSARNPMNILIYLSKNIKNSVWVNNMKMEENSISFAMQGTDTSEMNEVFHRLNNSTYFQGSLQFLNRSSAFDEKVNKDIYTYLFTGEVKDWGETE